MIRIVLVIIGIVIMVYNSKQLMVGNWISNFNITGEKELGVVNVSVGNNNLQISQT